jgi:arylsulfatase A-like enzyme
MKRMWLLCMLLFLAACSGPAVRGPARHVIFISMDTARADHFGFMGSVTAETPRLDALAEESIVFTNYMTVVPTTLASHVSLLTGKYPHHHGTPRNGFMVNTGNEMLTEILAEAGFHTAGFAGSFSLDSRFDFAQGFIHYDQEFDVLVGDAGADQNQRSAAAVTDAVIEHLDELESPDHVFLFVHYFDPHRPYSAPEPFDVAEPGDEELPSIPDLKRDEALSESRKLACARRYEQKYRAEITYMDHHIGRLLDDLRRRGILDEAILVVTSDHGESLWEHGEEFDHGYGVYESTVHSVCMVRLPDAGSGGTRMDGAAASIDVFPTVLDYLGLPVPESVDGEAIALAEPGGGAGVRTRGGAPGEGSSPGGRVRFSQATKPWRGLETDPRWTNILKARCVREGRMKYVQTPYRGTEELYDVVADPAETTNLLVAPTPEQREIARRLGAELERWMASAAPLPSRFESSQTEETIERLRSLGYLN